MALNLSVCTERHCRCLSVFSKRTPHIPNYNLKKIGLKYYKRQKAPKYSKTQLEQVARKCRKIRRQIATPNMFIIVDDEKYFTFSNDDMPQNVGFYAFDKEHAPDSV